VATARDGAVCEKAIFHKLTGKQCGEGFGAGPTGDCGPAQCLFNSGTKDAFWVRNDEISLDEVEQIGI
jgi:hypothetical protein